MIDEAAIGARYLAVAPLLDERARRLMAGSEALAVGRGGLAAVARATGLARTTVQSGMADVRAGETLARGRIRRDGAGRPRAEERDPTLRADLEVLIERVYDIGQNEAWVSVGTDHDTATFAVEGIRRWWTTMGQPLYPDATRLLVTADGGGSMATRRRGGRCQTTLERHRFLGRPAVRHRACILATDMTVMRGARRAGWPADGQRTTGRRPTRAGRVH